MAGVLIVQFARDRQHERASRFDAAVEAARVRLWPIVMKSFAFILSVLPLVIATGPGRRCAAPSGRRCSRV